MLRRGVSYTGDGRRRQSADAARVAAAVLVALALGGCSILGHSSATAPDPTITGSISPISAGAAAGDKVDPSDWETVRTTLAGAAKGAVDGLEWFNPDTGTSGTITATATAKNGLLSCRSFDTTVNDVYGVRRYRGQVCVAIDGHWRLRDVTPDDAAIS